ncbi:MAG: PD40 domain-containing protein [Anaerolineae bacterium]|nr:PD40 domain-containing protein [Anaerolineae bacterium]
MQDCPQCGEPLGGATIVCPHCGATLIQEKRRRFPWLRKPKSGTPGQLGQPTPTVVAEPRHLWRRLLLALVAIVVFVGVMAAAAYYGVYVGERDRRARREAVIEEHYQAGIVALNDGRHERAAAEFEYVLGIDAGNALAEQGLAEARARLQVQPTPPLEAAVSLAEQLLAQAQAAYGQQDWVSTARTLTQLRALDPNFAQADVEAMLFDSLYQAGIGYLDQDLLEVGISYLDQAIALRPLDADVVARRNLAVRYLDALNYWGVDWELCIERFEALAATAPDYKDVTQRLYRAHIEYGDYLASQGEMCPAEIEYSRALRMFADTTLEERRASAAQTCLIATPVPVSGTVAGLTPQPIAGFTSGRLAYPVYNATTGVFGLYALYADGRIIPVANNADQPWWEWNTGRVAYRDRNSASVQMELPEEGVPLQLLTPAQQAWPTLSPDSQRLAYAIQESDGAWAIYIANTNGVGEPQRLAAGWAPAWSRSGLLAYTGCDGQGLCGIILDNPDDDQPGGRLTGSESDTAVSWAPGSNMMAYMGNVTGNWDIFLLSPEGGVQQLTTDASDEALPAWSPDGSSIAFVSNRSGSWAIYVMNLGARDVRQILDLGPTLPGIESQRLSWAP